jgi:hypothetical protein
MDGVVKVLGNERARKYLQDSGWIMMLFERPWIEYFWLHKWIDQELDGLGMA